jgi:hypothetical protein
MPIPPRLTDRVRRVFPDARSSAGGTIYRWPRSSPDTADRPRLCRRATPRTAGFRAAPRLLPADAASPAMSSVRSAAARPDLSSTCRRARCANYPRGRTAERADVRLMLEAGWPVAARHARQHGPSLGGLAWNPDMPREILKHDPPLRRRMPATAYAPRGAARIHTRVASRDGDYVWRLELLLDAGARRRL